MRYLFCGSRWWKDRGKIEAVIKTLSPAEDLVIEGGAPGADLISGALARQYGIPLAEFPAHWGFYNKAAGPIRNGWMLKFGLPEKVYAFHEDIERSKGTKDMIERAGKKGIPVTLVS